MKIQDLPLKDAKIIELDVFRDSRGFFVERYQKEKFAEIGIHIDFVQDNFSWSQPRVLRGLHFQKNPCQGKLVSVVAGKIWDVLVDLRPHSPTFKKYVGIELSYDKSQIVWVPEGFAHGFCVLGEEAAGVFYKVNNFFSLKGDGGLLWKDPQINIQWPIDAPLLSDKDAKMPLLSEIDLTHFQNC